MLSAERIDCHAIGRWCCWCRCGGAGGGENGEEEEEREEGWEKVRRRPHGDAVCTESLGAIEKEIYRKMVLAERIRKATRHASATLPLLATSTNEST